MTNFVEKNANIHNLKSISIDVSWLKVSYCITLAWKMLIFFHINTVKLYEVWLQRILICRVKRSGGINTLDACWIAVNVWSNSSRCRQESVYLSWTWCLYTWSYLYILITLLNSVNCSTVICSPTVKYLCSWEKPLVKPMAPRSIFYHISLQSILLCNLYFQSIS